MVWLAVQSLVLVIVYTYDTEIIPTLVSRVPRLR